MSAGGAGRPARDIVNVLVVHGSLPVERACQAFAKAAAARAVLIEEARLARQSQAASLFDKC
jgi:hypothetical protein